MNVSNRPTLLERTPTSARTIVWAFLVATINFGVWALATHSPTNSSAVTIAIDEIADTIDQATSTLFVTH